MRIQAWTLTSAQLTTFVVDAAPVCAVSGREPGCADVAWSLTYTDNPSGLPGLGQLKLAHACTWHLNSVLRSVNPDRRPVTVTPYSKEKDSGEELDA